MPPKFIQVSTTVDSEKVADRVAARLLRERLASCVQVFGPIRSSYWWNGKIEHVKEWYCLIKARAKDYRSIEATISEVHSYKVPEILAAPVLEGNPDYLRWIGAETSRKPTRRIHRSARSKKLE